MPTYPLTTLAPTVNAAGITAPPYSDILLSLQESFKIIYGSDIYIQPDSQDGQWLAILAKSMHDSNQVAIAVFQSFSPAYAQGAGLSSVVKINGLTRNISGYSVADGNVVGQAGTVIIGGIVQDTDGIHWILPSPITIPIGGMITVTATCSIAGAVIAIAGSISKIFNPQLGWQSFVSTSDAVIGAPVESDSMLRERQTVSTALPSKSVQDGIIGAVANVLGVIRYKGYENDQDTTDGDGIPRHSIALIVDGGDSASVANAIAIKKTPGTGTYGTTSVTIYDSVGVPNVINFFRPTIATIGVEITITPAQGYTTGYADLVKAAVSESLNALDIGDDVLINKLFVPANLPGTIAGSSFDISLIRIKKGAGAFGTTNIVIAFNEAAFSSAADITVIVL